MEMGGESKPDSDSRQAAEHVKKQEHPQTHEEREVKTLVDRIEKKVSDQKLATPKRNLRSSNGLVRFPPSGSARFAIASSRFPWNQ